MNEQQKTKLRQLLLDAIDAYQKLQEAEKNLELARAAFGYSKLYDNEPRLINIDGKLWKVTVPFPCDRQDVKGVIKFECLGDFL
jgi:hypothetical protein